MVQPASVDSGFEPADDMFEMANLYPDSTGLPMTIWVSTRGGAKHDARIKVNQQPGKQMDPGNTAVVAIRPTPQLREGRLNAEHLALVYEWVRMNETALIDLWDGRIDFIGFAGSMRKV